MSDSAGIRRCLENSAVLLLLMAGCGKAPQPSLPTIPSTPPKTTEMSSIRFVEVTRDCGVAWTARNGEEAGFYTLLESFGSGCAIDDFDRDDRLDLMFAGGGRISDQREILPLPVALYRQVSNWKFEPVTEHAGLQPIRHYHHGTWSMDADEDGFPDLLITGWGGLQLFHNQGDGTFVDTTATSGLDDTSWSLGAAWGDFNQDHILDLFIGHYVDWTMENNPICNDARRGARTICDPTRFNGLPCSLYLSNGDGTFRDAGAELGVQGIGKTLGVIVADVNGDDRADIYVANDTVANQLYESQPSGQYREVALRSGVALAELGSADGSMGADIGDVDGDGRLDIWVANYENQSFALYRSVGKDVYTHASRAFGITAVGLEAVGFGTMFIDADGDGRLDIFCTNGHTFPPAFPQERRQLPYLFWNDHGKKFRNVASEAGEYMRQRHLGRGAASGDLDANGTPDLVVTHTNEPASILRNETDIRNWLAIRLVGRTSPRSGVGATATISSGQHRQMGVVKGGSSYLSTCDRELLFGLGPSTSVETVVVRWPSGKTRTLTNVAANQRLQLVEEE